MTILFILIHSWVFDRVQGFLKRVVDIIIGLLGSAITVILLPFIALAIFIDSPGPIFYTQKRLGQGGRSFKVIKFRTMIPDAHREILENPKYADLKEKWEENGNKLKIDRRCPYHEG